MTILTTGEDKTRLQVLVWKMPRELLKDLKRYTIENDTNVTAVVARVYREFLAKDRGDRWILSNSEHITFGYSFPPITRNEAAF